MRRLFKYIQDLMCYFDYHNYNIREVYSEHFPELQEFEILAVCKNCGVTSRL